MVALFTHNNLSVRHLTHGDAPHLALWFGDPRVQPYWEGVESPSTEAEVIDRFWGDDAEGHVVLCLVERDGEPIGFLQYLHLADEPDTVGEYGLDDADPGGIWGIDLFIGVPELWNQGIGTELVRGTVAFLFRELAARKMVIDPQTWNERGIRCYEKAGFRKVKLLPHHERYESEWRDSWLMVVERKEGEEVSSPVQ